VVAEIYNIVQDCRDLAIKGFLFPGVDDNDENYFVEIPISA
jgi:hypothetical protein